MWPSLFVDSFLCYAKAFKLIPSHSFLFVLLLWSFQYTIEFILLILFWGIFVYVYQGYWPVVFLWHHCLVLKSGYCWPHEMDLEDFFLASVFWRVWKELLFFKCLVEVTVKLPGSRLSRSNPLLVIYLFRFSISS